MIIRLIVSIDPRTRHMNIDLGGTNLLEGAHILQCASQELKKQHNKVSSMIIDPFKDVPREAAANAAQISESSVSAAD